LVGDGAEQAVLRRHETLRGIEHQERAGSISALGIAGGKACLPDESRLLIAGNSADGQGLTEN
jgi:hypothetical protein